MKVSKKGYLFKTYEGQLNIEGFGAVRADNSFSQTFEFSIEKNQDEVVRALEEAALKGAHVSLHYNEKYFTFFWKGETKYFVDEVKFNDGDEPTENSSGGAPFE